jgi:ankyrin repeat protein
MHSLQFASLPRGHDRQPVTTTVSGAQGQNAPREAAQPIAVSSVPSRTSSSFFNGAGAGAGNGCPDNSRLTSPRFVGGTNNASSQPNPMETDSSTDGSFDEDSASLHDEETAHFQSQAESARLYLEELGIDVGAKESGGLAALMVAAWENRYDLVENLLAANVPADSVDAASGDTALILAASLGHAGVVKRLLDVPGLALDHANQNGDTALMLASSGNCPEVVELLIKRGADVNLLNCRHGYTALMLASAYGSAGAAQKLVAAPRIELDRANLRGDTALILACSGKHADVVKCLLAAGAATTPVGSHALTAFGIAVQEKNVPITELLLAHHPETGDTFNASSGLQDAFSVAVTDLLLARDRPSPFEIAEPLAFFRTLSDMIPVDGDTRLLLQWLRKQGVLMACAQELVALLAPAGAWAPGADRGREGDRRQQRLIYCISAVGQLGYTGAAERVRHIYQQAGTSPEGLGKLDKLARQQLGAVASSANTAAALLGGDLINLLIDHCLQQTSPKYEVRVLLLQECLVQAGFIEPLAMAVASGWQAVLAGMQQKQFTVPAGLSFVGILEHIHKHVIGEAQTMLARALKERLKEHALLSSFQVMLPPKQEEAVHVLFQTQCNWLSQFCEQSLEFH